MKVKVNLQISNSTPPNMECWEKAADTKIKKKVHLFSTAQLDTFLDITQGKEIQSCVHIKGKPSENEMQVWTQYASQKKSNAINVKFKYDDMVEKEEKPKKEKPKGYQQVNISTSEEVAKWLKI